MIPWAWANRCAASNTWFWVNALASMWPALTSPDRDGASPWYRRPPACTGVGTKVWPSVYIGSSGAICPVSPKSYAYRPLVSVGHAAGSQATNRVCAFPRSRSAMNGYASPA